MAEQVEAFKNPIDVANAPLTGLMPTLMNEGQLYVAGAVCEAIVVARGREGHHQLLGSLAADSVQLPDYVQTMKDNAERINARGASGPKNSNKKGGRSTKGSGRTTQSKVSIAEDAAKVAKDTVNPVFTRDELRRLCGRATKALELTTAVAKAVTGEPGPLLDLDWDDSTLPPNMSDDQKLVVDRFNAYLEDVEPEDIAVLPEFSPTDKLALLDAVIGVAMDRTALAEMYMGGLCIEGLRIIAPAQPAAIQMLNSKASSMSRGGRQVTYYAGLKERDNVLNSWKTGIRSLPPWSRDPAILAARYELLEDIRVSSPVVFGSLRRSKDARTSGAVNNVLSANSTMDTAIDVWGSHRDEFLPRREPIEEQVRAEAVPLIAELRQKTERRNSDADNWLLTGDGQELDPIAANMANLFRNFQEVDPSQADQMAILIENLLAGAINPEAEQYDQWRQPFLRSISGEMESLREGRQLMDQIIQCFADVPDDLVVVQGPLGEAVSNLLTNWEEVEMVLSLRYSGSQGQAAVERSHTWLQEAQGIMTNYEEVRSEHLGFDDIAEDQNRIINTWLRVEADVREDEGIDADAEQFIARQAAADQEPLSLFEVQGMFVLLHHLRSAVEDRDKRHRETSLADLRQVLADEHALSDQVDNLIGSMDATSVITADIIDGRPLRSAIGNLLDDNNWDLVQSIILGNNKSTYAIMAQTRSLASQAVR